MNNFEVSNNFGGSSVFMQDILSNHNKPQEKNRNGCICIPLSESGWMM